MRIDYNIVVHDQDDEIFGCCRSCSCPLTGNLTQLSSTCICGRMVKGVSTTTVTCHY